MGRAIAAQALNHGERKALEAVKRAIRTHGEDNPVVMECMQILLCIARGEDGYRGRYIGDRYRAVCRLLDQLDGKPTEKRPSDSGRGAFRAYMDKVKGGDV